MRFEGFSLLPAHLLSTSPPDMEDLQALSAHLGYMQRYVHWWLGDMALHAEAMWGDDWCQAIPEGLSSNLLERCAGVSRNYPVERRFIDLSWSHHVIALRIKDLKKRNSLLQRASSESMSTKDFSALVTKERSHHG